MREPRRGGSRRIGEPSRAAAFSIEERFARREGGKSHGRDAFTVREPLLDGKSSGAGRLADPPRTASARLAQSALSSTKSLKRNKKPSSMRSRQETPASRPSISAPISWRRTLSETGSWGWPSSSQWRARVSRASAGREGPPCAASSRSRSDIDDRIESSISILG